MLGAVIGDIAGSKYEFNNYLNTDFELMDKDCEFTDDTICTIAVADALLHDLPFGEALHRWCRKYRSSYGLRFSQWIQSENPKPYHSFGNGSAMRVSPCAFFYPHDRDMALEAARLSAVCTHDHPEGVKGAQAIADCIWQALNGASKEQIRDLVTENYGYNLAMDCDSIRKTNHFDETCQVTVPQAIVCFLESHSFENSIRLAVSIGGDSDTIAAMTGGIAEAFYSIPDELAAKALGFLPKEFIDIRNEFDAAVKAKS